MSTLAILQQMEFCKTQITKYNDMYEKLLNDYRCLTMATEIKQDSAGDFAQNLENVQQLVNRMESWSKSKRAPVKKPVDCECDSDNRICQIHEDKNKAEIPLDLDVESDSDDEPEDDESDEKDLLAETLAMIVGDEDVELQVRPTTRIPESKPQTDIKSTPDSRSDALIDELLAGEKLRGDLKSGMSEDQKEMDRIDQKKYNARAGLEDHDAKLAKIYAREKELLAQGLSADEVRKRVREELYPEAIPREERKRNPQINVFVEDRNGKLREKKMILLAWNDDDFEDDNPELTQQIEDTQGKPITDFQEPVSQPVDRSQDTDAFDRSQDTDASDRSQNMPTLDLPTIEENQSLYDKVNALLDEEDNPDDVVNEEVVNH